MTEVQLIEQAALRAGMKSLMNNGAASCVYSEGCNGVTQDQLIAFTREIALHCAAQLGATNDDAHTRRVLEQAAAAVEQHDRAGREWIPTSLWGQLSREAAARIRALAPA